MSPFWNPLINKSFKLSYNWTLLKKLQISVIRNHQQITSSCFIDFIHKPKNAHPLLLTENTKLNGIPTKIKWKIYKIQSLGPYISYVLHCLLYISRYISFFHIIWKDFCHTISFFRGFKQPKSVKPDKNFLLMLPYYLFPCIYR